MTTVNWASHLVRLSLLTILPMTSVACGSCSKGAAKQQPVRARNIIVAVDFSGSVSEAALQEGKTLLRSVVDSLKPDDRIALLHVEGGGMQHGNGWSTILPHANKVTEQHEFEAAVEDVRLEVSKLFRKASSLKDRGTDILSTLFKVSEHLADAGNRQSTLLLMSDMIQAGNGVSFVKSINASSLVNELKASKIVPNLGGLCVTVVGADASTVQGVKIREFWKTYFDATGANFSTDRYRHSVAQSESLFCAPVQSELPFPVGRSASVD